MCKEYVQGLRRVNQGYCPGHLDVATCQLFSLNISVLKILVSFFSFTAFTSPDIEFLWQKYSLLFVFHHPKFNFQVLHIIYPKFDFSFQKGGPVKVSNQKWKILHSWGTINNGITIELKNIRCEYVQTSLDPTHLSTTMWWSSTPASRKVLSWLSQFAEREKRFDARSDMEISWGDYVQ